MNMPTVEEIKKRFVIDYTENIKREGSDNLLRWLESTDFFTAPASTRYHGAYEGGLCYHSLSVFYQLQRMYKAYSDKVGDVSKESLAICSLLHDLCKIECYSVGTKNVKENGQWVQKPFYQFDEKFSFGGHGSKSVYLIQKYMKLTDEEAVAINCHMGTWDTNETSKIGDAYKNYPLAWLVHVADEASSFIIGA